MSAERRLEFVRVLIAASWADGEITYQELNALKDYFRRLDITDEEYTELQPYLADPIGPEEAKVIIDDFLATAGSAERKVVLAAIRDLLLADGELGEGEREFLALLEEETSELTTAGVFVSRLKRLWHHSDAKGDDERRPLRRSELVDDFVRNRVLYQVKRSLFAATGQADLDADTERDLRWVCTLGALLGRVAHADGVFSPAEAHRIADLLDEVGGLRRSDVTVIVEIIVSEVLKDIDYVPLAREFDAMASHGDRARVLELLYEVAAADGVITSDEIEEVRRIAKALHIDRALLAPALQRARERLAGRGATE